MDQVNFDVIKKKMSAHLSQDALMLDTGQIVSVDLCQLRCPEPLMMLRQAMRAAELGQHFHIFATDPSTQRDFESFCRFRNHQMHYKAMEPTGNNAFPNIYFYILEKGQESS